LTFIDPLYLADAGSTPQTWTEAGGHRVYDQSVDAEYDRAEGALGQALRGW
jgi:hypothetical protein